MSTSRLSLARAVGALALAAVAAACSKSDPVPTGPNSEYVLELRWLGTAPEGATLETFNSAAATLRSIIVGGLPSVSLPAASPTSASATRP